MTHTEPTPKKTWDKLSKNEKIQTFWKFVVDNQEDIVDVYGGGLENVLHIRLKPESNLLPEFYATFLNAENHDLMLIATLTPKYIGIQGIAQLFNYYATDETTTVEEVAAAAPLDDLPDDFMHITKRSI